jgi:neutral amino acid transport system ATP-binding protein
MLEIKKVSKSFGGIKAVNNCSFKIERNKITALIGPNGSGKSTLFNLISGVLKEDSGKIFLDGEDITDYSPVIVSNSGVSRLFQKSQLFDNLTVRENLLLAMDDRDVHFWSNLLGKNKITIEKEKKVKEMLNLFEMEKISEKTARELSYGQKRLVEILRTILNPHKILIFDEPIAGVSPKLREEISKLFISLKKQGITILLIEHDMNFVLGIADNIIVLDEGRVIAEGIPSKIVKNKQVLEAYLGD